VVISEPATPREDAPDRHVQKYSQASESTALSFGKQTEKVH